MTHLSEFGKRHAWIFLVWVGLPAMTAFMMASSPEAKQPFVLYYCEHVLYWFPWVPMTYALRSLITRHPPTRPRLVKLLFILSILCFVAILLSVFWSATIYSVLRFHNGFRWEQHLRMALNGGWLMDFFLFWTVAGGLLSVHIFQSMQLRADEAAAMRLRNAELQGELAHSQLALLRTQLQPHFLFNTLNTIAALLRKQDSDGALLMLTRLADLLRYALSAETSIDISLREELRFNELYLEIEKIRYGERLTVDWAISQEAWAAKVPAMLLHPLVENAVRHGIAATIGHGSVAIDANRDGETLEVRIFNQGPAFGDSRRGGNGIGLSNTRQRLETLYGSEAQLLIENVSDPDQRVTGVVAILRIPFEQIAMEGAADDDAA